MLVNGVETETVETEVVETEDNSSQSETTEPQTEETQTEEAGEKETGEEAEGVETEESAETTEGEEVPVEDKKADSREAYLKRQLDKKDREIVDLRQKSGAVDTQRRTAYAEKQKNIEGMYKQASEYMQMGEFETGLKINREANRLEANMINEQQMAPLQRAFYKSQYSVIKKEISNDPDIVSFKDIEADIDAISREFEISNPIVLTSKEVIKNWALLAQGRKLKTLLKANTATAKKATIKNRQIIGEASVPSAKTGGGATVGFTSADKAMAEKHTITLEKAKQIRLNREKKEAKNKK